MIIFDAFAVAESGFAPPNDCSFMVTPSAAQVPVSSSVAFSSFFPAGATPLDISAFAAVPPLRLDAPVMPNNGRPVGGNDAFHREKPYSCSYCFKRFSTKTHRTVHERIHTGEKPFACRFCQRRFALRHHVTYHERTHTGEKPYSCNICLKRFSQSSHLLYHKRIHAACAAASKDSEPLLLPSGANGPA